MNDSLTEDKALLAEATVYDYLQNHPEFFQRYPQLLNQLRLPHQQRGSISLVERQLELQREKIIALEDDITRLMSIARQNEHIFAALNTLHIQLLQNNHSGSLEQQLQQFAAAMPGVHACRLLPLHTPEALSQYQLLLSRRLQQNIYLGRLNKEEQAGMFSGNIHSVALILIQHQNNPVALLAFGSEQDDHFQPSMDNLFVTHLAELVALVLQQV